MDTVITVNNLGKKYLLYETPQDRLKEALHPFRKKYHQDFWALRDVSFEIKKGETVGIVGRNGSGKSTLLQLICGTLSPTEGSVKVDGRVAALLELGAGFNPNFTGRENIFFNAAIIGFSREEVNERLDKILAFADIGRFIDQPVKTYSSGMYVRLAFAIAINVDPDILIVDEALAVGDEAFQRKCFSRLKAAQEKGSTVLFVSHSASIVVELCDRALLLEEGELLLSGSPKAVVANYHKLIYASPEKAALLREVLRGKSGELPEEKNKGAGASSDEHPVIPKETEKFDPHLIPKSTLYYDSRGAVIREPRITTLNGKQVNILCRGQDYLYTYTVEFEKEAYNVRFGMMIKTVSGLELGGLLSHPSNAGVDHIAKRSILRLQFRFRCVLLPGVYFCNAGLVGAENDTDVYLHRIIDAVMFRVQPEKEKLVSVTVDFSVPGHQAKIMGLGEEI